MKGRSRVLTYDERATYGDCPVCGAAHGERCDSNVGFRFGQTASGSAPADGVHLGRLNSAPFEVLEVPVR